MHVNEILVNFINPVATTMLCHKPQAVENSFKRQYGEVEDNIIIKKDLRSNESRESH